MGRPLKYKTVEEIQEAIDGYFEQEPEFPTVTGLTYHLGFAHRKSLTDYKGKDEFSNAIKRAILRIEMIHERRLFESNATGSIFWLKNKGWTDKQEIDHKNNGGKFERLEIVYVESEQEGT